MDSRALIQERIRLISIFIPKMDHKVIDFISIFCSDMFENIGSNNNDYSSSKARCGWQLYALQSTRPQTNWQSVYEIKSQKTDDKMN